MRWGAEDLAAVAFRPLLDRRKLEPHTRHRFEHELAQVGPVTHVRVNADPAYFAATGGEGFYPSAAIVFEIREAGHYHVPLLLSPYGYSTYRGS